MGTALAQVRALKIRSGLAVLHCTNGLSRRGPFTPWWARMVGKQALMMTSSHVASTTSARGLSGETCLGRYEALGRTTRGRGGGAKIRRITLPFSFSPITHAVPWL